METVGFKPTEPEPAGSPRLQRGAINRSATSPSGKQRRCRSNGESLARVLAANERSQGRFRTYPPLRSFPRNLIQHSAEK